VAECIHGFEGELCDSCYPKSVPERPRWSRVGASPPIRRTPTVTTSRKSINVGEQRIYHVTHVRNLDAILDAAELRADASPVVDVSSDLTRELRLSAEVIPGQSVAEYVPFYLSPDSALWEDLRGGAQDETRWSPAARASASSDFVVLVSTAKQLGDDAVITDGDAAGSLTRFASSPDEFKRMLVSLHDADGLRSAEALAKGSFPFSAVQLVGVANEPMRERVRDLVGDTKVVVYPPWFVPA
jgi:hypothetical protein